MLRFGIPDNEMKQNEPVPEYKEEPVYIERKAKNNNNADSGDFEEVEHSPWVSSKASMIFRSFGQSKQ
jgi:hypothetical protein